MSDLALRVALAIEPEPGPIPEDAWEKYMAGSATYSPGQCWEITCDYNKGDAETWGPRDFPSDRNLAPLMYKEMERREQEKPGTIVRFTNALAGEVITSATMLHWVFALLNATPEQICRAFLAAVGGE